jgi:hypothetical protein
MNALDDWVHAGRERLTWLDTDRYVWSVFAGACEHWYDDPGTMIGATAQAQKLLRSDVLGVDLLGPFSRHLVVADSAATVGAVLEREELRRDLLATVDALLHQFGDSVAVVLECPSPRRVLGEEADFDALDDTAAALLDVVRAVSDRAVHGLQITCDTVGGPDEDELDSWSSLLAAARHYRWITAIRLNGVSDPGRLDAALPGDLLLLPYVEAELLPDDRRHGGGLPPSVWTGASDAPRLVDAAAKRQFRFGEIPQDAAPETVLARITALQTA